MLHRGIQHPSLQPVTIPSSANAETKKGDGTLIELRQEKGRVDRKKSCDSLHAKVKIEFYLKLEKRKSRKRL